MLGAGPTAAAATGSSAAAAAAWAAELQEGLAAHLAAASSTSTASSGAATAKAESSWAAAKAAAAAPTPLSDACVPAVGAVGADSGRLAVTVCVAHLNDAVPWLAGQAGVLWVQSWPRVRANNLYGSAIVQAGSKLRSQPPLPSPAANLTHFPFWNAGLDGKGQVVGVTDTGESPGALGGSCGSAAAAAHPRPNTSNYSVCVCV